MPIGTSSGESYDTSFDHLAMSYPLPSPEEMKQGTDMLKKKFALPGGSQTELAANMTQGVAAAVRKDTTSNLNEPDPLTPNQLISSEHSEFDKLALTFPMTMSDATPDAVKPGQQYASEINKNTVIFGKGGFPTGGGAGGTINRAPTNTGVVAKAANENKNLQINPSPAEEAAINKSWQAVPWRDKIAERHIPDDVLKAIDRIDVHKLYTPQQTLLTIQRDLAVGRTSGLGQKALGKQSFPFTSDDLAFKKVFDYLKTIK